MKLKKFLKAVDGYVCGGSEYQWKCFPNAQFMDVSDLDGNEIGGCIFSRTDQTVYQVEVHVYDDEVAYRWIDPKWSLEYGIEAEQRNVSKFNAYDDVDFTQVESEKEILDLLHSVIHKTYVHSKPIAKKATSMSPPPATPKMNPAAAWPFPTDLSMSSEDEDETLDGLDADWGNVDEEGFDVDEYRAQAGVLDEVPVEQKEFEVVLTVKHRFTVKARNMEAAGDKAKEFQLDMKSGGWPAGLSWEDRWVSKVAVTRRCETVTIEE